MNSNEQTYETTIEWTGNRGVGTESYGSYNRTWNIDCPGKPIIKCSNDPLLGGDPEKLNPEELLLSALSGCHMLWFLHLASDSGLNVHAYRDSPVGLAEVDKSGAGRFLRATLRPHILLARGSDRGRANALHGDIHKVCFIARSVSFPVGVEAQYAEGDA